MELARLIFLLALISTAICFPLQDGSLVNKQGTVYAISEENGVNQGTVSNVASAVVVPVAFSAYLSHNLGGLKIGQTVIFDKILINDGDGYDKSSGVFTVPVTGVYSFTYFLGSQGENQVFVVLTLNGKTMSEAGVQTNSKWDDGQGGNTSIFRADKGDVVDVKYTYGDGRIEGSETYRITTFSGHLLYVG